MTMNLLTQIIGWFGIALVVLAYFLLSTKRLSAQSKYYQVLNLFGAIAISINVFHQQAWPAFALQIIWGAIALLSIFKSNP